MNHGASEDLLQKDFATVPWESQLRPPKENVSNPMVRAHPAQYKTQPPTALFPHTYLDGTRLFNSLVRGQ